MKRGLYIFFLTVFAYTIGLTQNFLLQQANRMYAQKAYSEAIPLYEKALKTDSSDFIYSKLGDCYRYTNNINGQLLYYGYLVKNGKAESVQELYYGQALLQNGEPEKAKLYFEKYSSDERGRELASSLNKAFSYTRNSDAYMVTEAGFNSPQRDFCAVKYKDEVVFASSRTKNEWIRKEQGWTNSSYLSLYSTGLNDNGEQLPIKPFMNNLNSKFNNGPASFNKDYNKIFFTKNNTSKEDQAKDSLYKLAIYEASIEPGGIFGEPRKLPFVNKDYNYAHPSVTPDGYTVYFASDMEGGKGGMDIYVSHKDSSGVWSQPLNLGDKVNTAGNEVFPFIATNNVLYFASNGHDGLGGLDIYQAPIKNRLISKVYNMGEPINSSLDDFGLFLNESNKIGYISSNRKNGGMDDDVYNLLILRKVKQDKDVWILVKDKITNQPIANAKILINNKDTVVANERGEYNTTAEEGAIIKLAVFKSDYFKTEDSLSIENSLNESITKELFMEKDSKLFMQGIITDAANGNPLDKVTVRVTDIMSGENFNPYTTSNSGSYYKPLPGKKIGDRLTYLIRFEKEGYLPRSVVFTHEITQAGEININKEISFMLGKVQEGMDLAKMIDIKPIYFDIGKFDIHKDAATELDKIVQVMNEYPNISIEVGSHTDCRASAEANLALSAARAKAGADYIVKRGINKARITAKGYGESKPINACTCSDTGESDCSEEELAKNHRTEFIITKLK